MNRLESQGRKHKEEENFSQRKEFSRELLRTGGHPGLENIKMKNCKGRNERLE